MHLTGILHHFMVNTALTAILAAPVSLVPCVHNTVMGHVVLIFAIYMGLFVCITVGPAAASARLRTNTDPSKSRR